MGYSRYTRRSPRGGGLPPWLVFLIAVALVFGLYYLWDGARRFIRTGGLGVAEATTQAQIITTATAARATRSSAATATPRPSATPLPQCQAFVVSVVNAPTALVRAAPSPQGAIIDAFPTGAEVCVLWREPGTEYYAVDADLTTRRYEIAYMHESVLESLNPTATPSATITLPPTITPVPTSTPQPDQSSTPLPTVESAQPTLPPASSEGDDAGG